MTITKIKEVSDITRNILIISAVGVGAYAIYKFTRSTSALTSALLSASEKAKQDITEVIEYNVFLNPEEHKKRILADEQAKENLANLLLLTDNLQAYENLKKTSFIDVEADVSFENDESMSLITTTAESIAKPPVLAAKATTEVMKKAVEIDESFKSEIEKGLYEGLKKAVEVEKKMQRAEIEQPYAIIKEDDPFKKEKELYTQYIIQF